MTNFVCIPRISRAVRQYDSTAPVERTAGPIAGWVNGNLTVVLVPITRLLEQALKPMAHLAVHIIVVPVVPKRISEITVRVFEVTHRDIGHHPNAIFVGHER